MLNHLPSLARPPARQALDFEANQLRTWDAAVVEIDEAMALKENWDGVGAAPLCPALAAACPDVVAKLRTHGWPPPAYIRPTPDGCLSLEWELSREDRLEAEISPKEIHWILTTQQGVEVETESL